MFDRQSDRLAGPSDSLNRKWSLSVSLAFQSFHQSERLIYHLQSKFYDQCSSNDILSQGHLMVVSISCDMRKESFKDTFFEMNKPMNEPKNEPINFCKLYDEGTFQLLLRSDHFINLTVWYLVFSLNFLASILVMISYHYGI